jgi:hypothetical protein
MAKETDRSLHARRSPILKSPFLEWLRSREIVIGVDRVYDAITDRASTV